MTEKELLQIAEYLENKRELEGRLQEEAMHLRQLSGELKSLPLEKVPGDVDEKIKELISVSSQGVTGRQRMIRSFAAAIAIAATVIIFILNSLPGIQSIDYNSSWNTAEKISHLSNFYDHNLSNREFDLLREIIRNEKSPNVKVLALDLLNEYNTPIDEQIFATILNEPNSTVQLALLNAGGVLPNESFISTLRDFQKRNDLESQVVIETEKMIQYLTQ